MTDEIENVKRQNMAGEKSVGTLRKNLASEANNRSYRESCFFCENFRRKRKYVERPYMALEKLEEEFKLLK